jgi:hypothetical protein
VCVFSYTEFFNDCRKVALGLEPEMDVRAIYIHDIAVLWTAALRTQYYPGESVSHAPLTRANSSNSL